MNRDKVNHLFIHATNNDNKRKSATFHQDLPFSEGEKATIVQLLDEFKSSYNFQWHFCCSDNGVMITLDEPDNEISFADTDEDEGNTLVYPDEGNTLVYPDEEGEITLVDPDEVIIMDDGSEDIAQVIPEDV